MRKAAVTLLLAAAACGQGDNVVYGGAGSSNVTPVIQFDNINSVISGRVRLFDADGGVNGNSEVIIISDRPGLCTRLSQHPDYFRTPPETYLALILFLPPTNHLGTFEPGRVGDEGTGSEIIGVRETAQPVPPFQTTRPVAPFTVVNGAGYIALRDWSEQPGGESSGTFNLLYAAPTQSNLSGNNYQFYGKFKASVCPTLDGTLLP